MDANKVWILDYIDAALAKEIPGVKVDRNVTITLPAPGQLYSSIITAFIDIQPPVFDVYFVFYYAGRDYPCSIEMRGNEIKLEESWANIRGQLQVEYGLSRLIFSLSTHDTIKKHLEYLKYFNECGACAKVIGEN
nr:hypothetical protein K-LCC10_0106 [Kaumoebavirus]